jgi:hypothetical protein
LFYQAQSWTLTTNVHCSWWIGWRNFIGKEQREAFSNIQENVIDTVTISG